MAEETIDAYVIFMDKVFQQFPNPTPKDINVLKRVWIAEGKSASFINKALSSAANYFRMQGIEVKFKRLPEGEGIVEFLEEYEIRALWDTIDREAKNEHLRLRNRAIVASTLYGSARRKEICLLKADDVDVIKRIIKFRKPKNKKPDFSFLNHKGAEIFREWKDFRASHRFYQKTDAMFLGEHGETLTPDGVSQLMQRLSEQSGIHVTITILRHTLGTWMRLLGADLLDIKMQMRHRNIQSTLKYVNTANKILLKKRVDECVPEF